MTPERFQDRWEAFKGEPQQVSGIWGLYRSIAELEGSGDILDEHASWARKFSEKPPLTQDQQHPAVALIPVAVRRPDWSARN